MTDRKSTEKKSTEKKSIKAKRSATPKSRPVAKAKGNGDPTAKKVVARRRTTTPRPRRTATSPVSLDDTQRRQMVEEAAYYLAEHRDFANGSPEQDWVEAEHQISQMLELPAGASAPL